MNVHYTNNQTIKFILPVVLNLPASVLIKKELIGAYLGDVEKPQWDGKLILAYHYPWAADWQKFEKKIINSDNYISSYDYYLEDSNIVIYVFDVPQDAEETVNAVMEGLYSQINPVDKLSIAKFWIDFTGSTFIKDIFEGKYIQKNEELWYIPNFEEELFDIHKY